MAGSTILSFNVFLHVLVAGFSVLTIAFNSTYFVPSGIVLPKRGRYPKIIGSGESFARGMRPTVASSLVAQHPSRLAVRSGSTVAGVLL